jgi:hypothetical protein
VHWVTLAAAATLFAFGGGVFVGKGCSRGAGVNAPVIAARDGVESEVLAAGDDARSFPLEGGGRVTLKPGSIVEVQRAGGGVTLKLVQGDATLETPGGGAQPTLVVGDARLNTQASSTVTVSRRADNVDVGVSRGAASVASPSLTKNLESGENVSVPLHRTTAAVEPTATPIAVAGPHHAHHPEAAAPEASAVAVAGAAPTSDWQKAYNASDFPKAADLFRAERGEFDPAVTSANSAQELYELYTLAAAAKVTNAASRALHRCADEFPGDRWGQLASAQLCQRGAGDKYCKEDPSSPLYDPEVAACRALKEVRNKDEAARLAKEYLSKHPDGGTCRDDAQRIANGSADEAADAPHDGSAAKSDKSKPAPKP